MEWLDQFAEWVRRELDARDGPMTLRIEDVPTISGTGTPPSACFWSSLQAYLYFGGRGIEVEPASATTAIAEITFRPKRFVAEWLPADRCGLQMSNGRRHWHGLARPK
jgi:hypothetical protein